MYKLKVNQVNVSYDQYVSDKIILSQICTRVLLTFEGAIKSRLLMHGHKSLGCFSLWNKLTDQNKLSASKEMFYKVLKTHLFK